MAATRLGTYIDPVINHVAKCDNSYNHAIGSVLAHVSYNYLVNQTKFFL